MIVALVGAVGVWFIAGCGDGDTSNNEDGGPGGDSDTDADIDSDTDTDSDTDSDMDSDTEADAGPDAAVQVACDMVEQDCPDGEKCSGVRENAFVPWEGTACVPDNADGGAPVGMICFNGSDGTDTCGPDSMCVQFGGGEGACFAHCESGSNPPSCDGAYNCAALDESTGIRLCFQDCNPVTAPCPYDDLVFGCYPTSGAFACIPFRPFGWGEYGDACANQNDCKPGTWCAEPSQVPGCSGANGCCSTMCDTSEPNTCPGAGEGQVCEPFYQLGDAPPGAENLGLCQVQ